MKKPYVAASIYLNAAPLCYSFIYGKQRNRCEFLPDASPARCAELLKHGQADAALIPVIEYQRIPGIRAVAGACVASTSRVRSVVLASRVPINRIETVALDETSRTSAALVRIVLGYYYGLSPVYDTTPPNIGEMLESHDAALIIGDPAMVIERRSLHVYDMAEEWKNHTGLPFVFAFWAVRPELTTLPGDIDFIAAKDEGLKETARIANMYSDRLGLPAEELVFYLTRNISYELDDAGLRGLELYYRLSHECRLIEDVRDLQFI